MQKLKDATPAGVLLGSGKLATELDRLNLIDEYKFLVHPRIAGHGPSLYQSGLPSTRRLKQVSAKPLRSCEVAMHYRRALTQRTHRAQLAGQLAVASRTWSVHLLLANARPDDEQLAETAPKLLTNGAER